MKKPRVKQLYSRDKEIFFSFLRKNIIATNNDFMAWLYVNAKRTNLIWSFVANVYLQKLPGDLKTQKSIGTIC